MPLSLAIWKRLCAPYAPTVALAVSLHGPVSPGVDSQRRSRPDVGDPTDVSSFGKARLAPATALGASAYVGHGDPTLQFGRRAGQGSSFQQDRWVETHPTTAKPTAGRRGRPACHRSTDKRVCPCHAATRSSVPHPRSGWGTRPFESRPTRPWHLAQDATSDNSGILDFWDLAADNSLSQLVSRGWAADTPDSGVFCIRRHMSWRSARGRRFGRLDAAGEAQRTTGPTR